MSKPQFKGWRAVSEDERTVDGDVFVRIGGYINDKKTPETGDRLYGSSLGKPTRTWCSSVWWIYRKSDAVPIQRRLMMSRIFSQPLPLP